MQHNIADREGTETNNSSYSSDLETILMEKLMMSSEEVVGVEIQ